MPSSTPCSSRPTSTRTRTSPSRRTTPIPGTWRWDRSRTSTPNTCTALFPTGTTWWRTPTTTPLEARSLGQPAPRLHGAQPERRRVLGPGGSVGAVADLPPRRRARPRPHELHGGGPVVPRPVARTQGGQHRAHRPGRARNGARVPRDHRGALLPLLPARAGGETCLAGDHVPVGREPLAHLRRVATPGGPPHRPLSGRRRHAVIRAPAWRRERVPRVRLRSSQPGAVPGAAHLADLPGRRLADVGGPGPAVRRPAAGRAHARERSARPRSYDHRRSG